ncbi:MAG TPA: DUF4412 domain-containing protein [Candidatus Tectomicrobia bacterium]|nr:DUF4412 domain-containing protein [Candidatus Tectomicrobia bacterium]
MGRLGRGWVGRCGVVLWAIGLGMPMVAGAGWVIEQIEYANLGAEGTSTRQYIAKNRLKTVGEGNTFIMDFAKNLFIATDEENRVYWSGAVDEYVQEVKSFQQAANDLARAQMEEAMKEMPADQRQRMENLLQAMRGANASSPSSPASKRPEVKVEPTTETAMLAGYKASKTMVYADGKPYQEVWLSKGLTLKTDLDLKRLRGLQAKLTQAIMIAPPGREAVEEDPAYEQLLEQGYPLKIVELGEGGEPESVTEVVRIDKRDIPEREFQVPEGYRRIDLHEFFREELEKIQKGE